MNERISCTASWFLDPTTHITQRQAALPRGNSIGLKCKDRLGRNPVLNKPSNQDKENKLYTKQQIAILSSGKVRHVRSTRQRVRDVARSLQSVSV